MIGESPRFASAGTGRQPVSIRRAGAGELDSVMAVMDAAFAPCFGEAWTRSQCAGILPMSGVALRLAEDVTGEVAGFSLMRTVADEAELLLIAVHPDAQHRGVGAALLDDFVSLATEQGARRLHLEVREGNPAIALYERSGFTLAGRRRDYYRGANGETRDALTLAREVATN